jgi:hypothetical protein
MPIQNAAAGITALSQLQIDADKDWATQGISNIKEVVAGMAAGDIIHHDGTKLAKLSPGQKDTELFTLGPGHDPVWKFLI